MTCVITWVTRLLERGVPLAVVASLAGWSAATMARMQKRYSHFGNAVQRQPVALLDPAPATQDATKQQNSALLPAHPTVQ
jgi:hypothetical protein